MKKLTDFEILLFGAVLLFKLLMFNRLIGSDTGNIALLASIMGTVLTLVCWGNLLKGRLRRVFLYAADCTVTFIIIADLLFYRYFSSVISIYTLAQASDISSVKNSIISLIHISDVLFIMDLLIIPFTLHSANKVIKETSSSCGKRIVRAVSAFIAGIGLCSYGVSNLLKTQPRILDSFYDRVYIVQNIGLLSFHSIDAFRFMESNRNETQPVSEDKKEELKGYFRNKRDETTTDPEFFGAGKDKNLIVIQVEALQGCVIGRKINGREITPNLNKLIKSSLYFDNYYTQTAGGGTSDAELLSNVSLYPAKEGAAYIRFSGNDYYSLAKRMKEKGYYASTMHACRPGFWNRSVMCKSLGFDEFISKNNYSHDEICGMGLSDKSFFRQSLEYMEKHKEPYYSLLITLTSHHPFNNDKKYYSSFEVGEYKDTLFGNYLEAIHYTDEALGEFIGELERRGIADRSVLAVYGDHFAIPKDKKDYLAEFLGIEDMNDYYWTKQQRVPLIIHLPGQKRGVIKHIAGGGIDFMPTILNIMGVDGRNMPMLGRDLLNSREGMAVLRHGHFITDKYICLTSLGVAYDAESGSIYPIEKLNKEREFAAKQLEYSDIITENNLIKELTEHLQLNR